MNVRLALCALIIASSGGCDEHEFDSTGLLPDVIENDGEGRATFRSVVDNSVVPNGFRHNGIRHNGIRHNGIRHNGIRHNSAELDGVALTDVSYDPSAGGFQGLDGTLATLTLDAGEELIISADESDGTIFEIKVSAVEEFTGGVHPFQFQQVDTRILEVEDPETWGSWESACEDGAGNPVKAILLAGDWSSTDYSFIPDSDTDGLATWACRGAALAKCVEWGYHREGTYSSTALTSHHDACARMVRADYCGDGEHHTENGTSIDVEDSLGIQVHDSETTWDIEAAWGPNGALCLNNPRKTWWTRTDALTNCSSVPSCDQNSNSDLKDDEAYWYGQGALFITRNEPSALVSEPPAPPGG